MSESIPCCILGVQPSLLLKPEPADAWQYQPLLALMSLTGLCCSSSDHVTWTDESVHGRLWPHAGTF